MPEERLQFCGFVSLPQIPKYGSSNIKIDTVDDIDF